MGWYNVVRPCVVGQLHYARPTTQPIEVDDEVAKPLVEDGSLEPYPASQPESANSDHDQKVADAALRQFDSDAADAVEEHRNTQRARRSSRRAEG